MDCGVVGPGGGVTVKLWFTADAAAKFVLPIWVAWTVQVPGVNRVTVEPETVQTELVWELKLMGRFEDAVAASSNEPEFTATDESGTKVMVCVPCVIWKLWFTAVAAPKFVLPAWVA